MGVCVLWVNVCVNYILYVLVFLCAPKYRVWVSWACRRKLWWGLEIKDEEFMWSSFQPNTSEQKKTCTQDVLVEVEDFIIKLKQKTWLRMTIDHLESERKQD